MARHDPSTNRVRVSRSRASTRSGNEGAKRQVMTSSVYCAVCNLTFGSQERRIFWREKAAHPGCVRRVRRLEVA